MNENEFAKQRQAAVDRMREMNQRSKPNNNQTQNKNPQAKQNPQVKPSPPPKNTSLSFLDSIVKDSDTAIIIGLLLLLMSEKADKRLIFALIYILL